MRKLLFFVFSFFLFFQGAFSQCVPNDSIGGRYIYPSKITPARAGIQYNQVLTFRIPKDTDAIVFGAPVHAFIDSSRLLLIGGVPSGYGKSCDIPSCTWPGGSYGCALLSGISDSAGSQVGNYPIKIYIQTWFHTATSGPISQYDSASTDTFRILPNTALFENVKASPLHVFPNPSEGIFNIELRNILSDDNHLLVMDMTGRIVYEKYFGRPAQLLNTEQVDLSNKPKGLYIVSLSTESGVLLSKIRLQ